MQVRIKIYENENEDKYLEIDNCDDESKILIDVKGNIVLVSIEELKHALRKISCK